MMKIKVNIKSPQARIARIERGPGKLLIIITQELPNWLSVKNTKSLLEDLQNYIEHYETFYVYEADE